jgi:hypothetical protein
MVLHAPIVCQVWNLALHSEGALGDFTHVVRYHRIVSALRNSGHPTIDKGPFDSCFLSCFAHTTLVRGADAKRVVDCQA